MSRYDELAALHGALLEGTLDERGRQRLGELLATPGGRRDFAVLMRVDGGLNELLRSAAPSPSARIELAGARQRRPRPHRRQPSALRFWLPSLAAALIAAIGFLLWPQGTIAPAVPPPAAIQGRPPVEAPPMVIARWERPGGRPGLEAGGEATGPGVLVLDDGSRVELDAEARLRVVAPGRFGQDAGRLRVVAAPQAPGRSLEIATPQAVARVVGTVFTVTVGGDGTRVGVEEGRVAVVPRSGEPRAVEAGSALIVPPTGPPRPAPADAWRIALGSHPAGWFGTPVTGGLALAFDAATSAHFKSPTWNIQMPDPGVPGCAAFDPAATLRIRIRAARRAGVAVNIQTWSQDGSRWTGTVQREATLEAGSQDLVWPLSSFTVREGAGLPAMLGMPIRRLAVVAWDSEAGLVVESIAIARP
jgi:ferric-dicitrate binding protein FerR (iron transport regulator)